MTDRTKDVIKKEIEDAEGEIILAAFHGYPAPHQETRLIGLMKELATYDFSPDDLRAGKVQP